MVVIYEDKLKYSVLTSEVQSDSWCSLSVIQLLHNSLISAPVFSFISLTLMYVCVCVCVSVFVCVCVCVYWKCTSGRYHGIASVIITRIDLIRAFESLVCADDRYASVQIVISRSVETQITLWPTEITHLGVWWWRVERTSFYRPVIQHTWGRLFSLLNLDEQDGGHQTPPCLSLSLSLARDYLASLCHCFSYGSPSCFIVVTGVEGDVLQPMVQQFAICLHWPGCLT